MVYDLLWSRYLMGIGHGDQRLMALRVDYAWLSRRLDRGLHIVELVSMPHAHGVDGTHYHHGC